MRKPLNILILGSSGFIGKELTSYLKQGESHGPLKISTFCREKNGDYKKPELLQKALRGQDLVFHLISETFPASSWENPFAELESNLKPFIQFLDLMNIEKVKKVVFCSSGGTVYGINENEVSEESIPTPFSPHGITKLTMENFLEYARVKNGIQYDIFRLTNPYGPNQTTFKKGLGVIATWLNQIASGEDITIYGDGEILRDYIYIKDTVYFLAKSLSLDLEKSHRFNLASGELINLKELAHLIAKVIDHPVSIKFKEARKNDNPIVILNNKKLLTLSPNYLFTKLEEGILKTWSSINLKSGH